MSANRVLIVDFGAIARRGVQDALLEAGCEVMVTQDPASAICEIAAEGPDAVVLSLDRADTDALARRLVARYPAMRVVACSAESPTMHVYGRNGDAAREVSRLDSRQLAAAVMGAV